MGFKAPLSAEISGISGMVWMTSPSRLMMKAWSMMELSGRRSVSLKYRGLREARTRPRNSPFSPLTALVRVMEYIPEILVTEGREMKSLVS